ncbi:KH domain-containing protein [Candidatus Dependentiae bacterium]|nr:KH domain-containing protein [Candidatus Dependentiae bacterium]
MKELVEEIVKALVDNPEEVNILETGGNKAVIYEVKVDKTDIGKVIGKEGRIANAMRTIISAAAKKQGKRALLQIIED